LFRSFEFCLLCRTEGSSTCSTVIVKPKFEGAVGVRVVHNFLTQPLGKLVTNLLPILIVAAALFAKRPPFSFRTTRVLPPFSFSMFCRSLAAPSQPRRQHALARAARRSAGPLLPIHSPTPPHPHPLLHPHESAPRNQNRFLGFGVGGDAAGSGHAAALGGDAPPAAEST
jgi:hypothetical protein